VFFVLFLVISVLDDFCLTILNNLEMSKNMPILHISSEKAVFVSFMCARNNAISVAFAVIFW